MQTPLPIDADVAAIAAHVRVHRTAVIVAPPGSGKTTRIPPALAAIGRTILLQPRRVAARALARRIADERGWTIGNEIGWQIRFERRFSEQTQLLVATEGILTARLQSDPLLSDFDVIVLDEFHERSIHADVALAMARQAMEARGDLAVVVMSATIAAADVSRFLGGARVFDVGTRRFPVDVQYCPGISVANAVRGRLSDNAPGDILCFLPGMREIERTRGELANIDALVLPLHGSLEVDAQERALAPSPQRKVILATNIAETSLTVEGVTDVIDSGIHKVLRFDPDTAVDHLVVERISGDSAEQRAGRAGRTQPGRAIRLWDSRDILRPHREPDIHRVDLAPSLLDIVAWGGDPRTFAWFERPNEERIEAGLNLLAALGAIEHSIIPSERTSNDQMPGDATRPSFREGGAEPPANDTTLLPTTIPRPATAGRGRHGAKRSAGEGSSAHATETPHPRFADLLPAAAGRRMVDGVGPESSTLHRRTYLAGNGSDIGSRRNSGRYRMTAIGRQLSAFPLHPRLGRILIDAHGSDEAIAIVAKLGGGGPAEERELASMARRFLGGDYRKRVDDATLRHALLAGYPDRVAQRRERGSPRLLLSSGTGATVAREIDDGRGEFLVVLDITGDLARTVRVIEREWLIPTRREVVCELDGKRVRGLERSWYGAILLHEQSVAPEASEAERLLAQHAIPDPSLLQRVVFAGLDVDWAELTAAAVAGMQRLDDVKVELPVRLRKRLDELAPASFALPSGRKAKLDYRDDGSVIASAKLQELFGLAESPRIGPRRIPITFALLSPGGRPVQITQDLRSFWNGAYQEVRKELRERYPKHPWPEDPWTAPATHRAKRRF